MKQIMLEIMVIEFNNKWGIIVEEFGNVIVFVCVVEKDDLDYQCVFGLMEGDIYYLFVVWDFFIKCGIRGLLEMFFGLFILDIGQVLVNVDFLFYVMGCNYWLEVDKFDIKFKFDVEVCWVEMLEDLCIYFKVLMVGWGDFEIYDEDEEWLGY